jgi:hypothetical protein
MLAGILSSAAWFGLFLVAHLVAFRAKPRQDRSKTVLRAFAAAVLGHLASVGAAALLRPAWMEALGSSAVLSALAGLLTLACLFVLYMPFYYTLNTSLSVETLVLVLSCGGRMPVERVLDRFTSRAFILDRLETMRRNGYLEPAGPQAYTLSARGASVGSNMAKVKRWLDLGAGG